MSTCDTTLIKASANPAAKPLFMMHLIKLNPSLAPQIGGILQQRDATPINHDLIKLINGGLLDRTLRHLSV